MCTREGDYIVVVVVVVVAAIVVMTPRRSKIAAQLGKGDARDQQTRENPKRQRSTPFTDPMATETLNRRRRDLVNELQRSYFPMNANSNALAVVLVSGDKRSSEHDWAAICVDIDEHRDAKVRVFLKEKNRCCLVLKSNALLLLPGARVEGRYWQRRRDGR